MKKLIKYIIGIAATVVFFASCEKNEPILFQNSDSFVAFERAAGSVAESAGGVENVMMIRVLVATIDNSPLTVNFEFDTEGITNPAVEGEAFTLLNESKTLNFPQGMGYDTIWVKTMDDDIFTGNRSVNIKLGTNSAGYTNGAENSFRLTLVDDEHPLNFLKGTYRVDHTSFMWDDPAYTISIEPNSDDVNQIFLPASMVDGWGLSPNTLFVANVNTQEKTISIPAGSFLGNSGYGNTYLNPVESFISNYNAVPASKPTIDATYTVDGETVVITFTDKFGAQIVGGNNDQLWKDVYDVGFTMTRTGDKQNIVEEPVSRKSIN